MSLHSGGIWSRAHSGACVVNTQDGASCVYTVERIAAGGVSTNPPLKQVASCLKKKVCLVPGSTHIGPSLFNLKHQLQRAAV